MRLLNCTAPLSLDQGAIDSESEDDVPKSRRDLNMSIQMAYL